MKRVPNEFNAGCGELCRHFDKERRRCGARSVKAQAHYHAICMGLAQGDCEWFQFRNVKEKDGK